MSVSCSSDSIVLQNVPIGNWEQCIRCLSILFLTIACKSTIISIIIFINKIEPELHLSHLFDVPHPSGVDLC